MDRQWPIGRIEPEFLVELVNLELLSASVLSCGLDAGAIDAHSVVDIELRRMLAGIALTAREEEIATSLSRDEDKVAELLMLSADESSHVESRRFWTYVGAKKVRSQGYEFEYQMTSALASVILAMGDVDDYSPFVAFRPLKDFRRRFGTKPFLKVLDEKLDADGREYLQARPRG